MKLLKGWISTLILMLVLVLGLSFAWAEEPTGGTEEGTETEQQVDGEEPEGEEPEGEEPEEGDETPVGTALNAAQQAKVDNLVGAVETAGGTVTSVEIEAMRTAGMGWGEIAQALGVHPSTLGLGQKLGIAKHNSEMTQETARSMTGKAKGHGTGEGSEGESLGSRKSAEGKSGQGTANRGGGNAGGNLGNAGGNSGNAGGNAGGNSGNSGGGGRK
jgi:hypothetical protein